MSSDPNTEQDSFTANDPTIAATTSQSPITTSTFWYLVLATIAMILLLLALLRYLITRRTQACLARRLAPPQSDLERTRRWSCPSSTLRDPRHVSNTSDEGKISSSNGGTSVATMNSFDDGFVEGYIWPPPAYEASKADVVVGISRHGVRTTLSENPAGVEVLDLRVARPAAVAFGLSAPDLTTQSQER